MAGQLAHHGRMSAPASTQVRPDAPLARSWIQPAPTWLTVAAAALLATVCLKTWMGPGAHPTVHMLVLFWGMVGMTSIAAAATAFLARRGSLALHAPGTELWMAIASGTLLVVGICWTSVQLASNPIGVVYCRSLGPDVSACSISPPQAWIAVGVALAAGALGTWLAAIGSARLIQRHAPAGYVGVLALVLASLVPIGLASILVIYALDVLGVEGTGGLGSVLAVGAAPALGALLAETAMVRRLLR